jgi:hypothetical protein
MRRLLPLTLVLAGCATWRALFPQPPAPGWPERTTVIPVAQARAIDVAYADLAAGEDRDQAEDEDGGVDPRTLARLKSERACTHRPDFHEAWIYLDDAGSRYIVGIEPKFELCFDPKKEEVYGGGVIYEIDAKDFTILKKQSEE